MTSNFDSLQASAASAGYVDNTGDKKNNDKMLDKEEFVAAAMSENPKLTEKQAEDIWDSKFKGKDSVDRRTYDGKEGLDPKGEVPATDDLNERDTGSNLTLEQTAFLQLKMKLDNLSLVELSNPTINTDSSAADGAPADTTVTGTAAEAD